MQWTALVSVSLALLAVTSTKIGPPPVMLDLGPMAPTPAPTPRHADKKRLVTTITVQNNEEGDSVVSFEVTDFADNGEDKKQMIASKRYGIAEAEETEKLKPLAEKIMRQVRDLERDMLEFAQVSGPPKPRAPSVQNQRPR